MAGNRTLREVLASVSDALFPAELGEKPVAIDSRGCDGDTPLHVLAWRNDVAGAAMLIAAGADVNAIGDMSETPLHVAIAMNSVEMAGLLCRSGANREVRSEFGETPLEKASRKGGLIEKVVAMRPNEDM
jgi:ankyrin repeat protein